MRRIILLLCCSFLYGETVEEMKYEVCETLPELPGWCSEEKALSFIDLVLEVQPKLCVEIGVYGGKSVLPVACALKFLDHGTMIAIDPWDVVECIRYMDPDKDKKNLKWWAPQNLDHAYYGFVQLLRQFELEKCCLIARTTSKKAAAAIGPIDILHIDGNHHESVLLSDVQLYLPKVNPGGYIWLNDAKWGGFKPAVDLILTQCDEIKSVDNGNCVLFRKKL